MTFLTKKEKNYPKNDPKNDHKNMLKSCQIDIDDSR